MLQHQRSSRRIVSINEAEEVVITEVASRDVGEEIKHKAGTTNKRAKHIGHAVCAVNTATTGEIVARLGNSRILSNKCIHFVSNVERRVILV
jgi:hypothetical protein